MAGVFAVAPAAPASWVPSEILIHLRSPLWQPLPVSPSVFTAASLPTSAKRSDSPAHR